MPRKKKGFVFREDDPMADENPIIDDDEEVEVSVKKEEDSIEEIKSAAKLEQEAKKLAKKLGISVEDAKEELLKPEAVRAFERDREIVAGSLSMEKDKVNLSAEDHGEKIGRVLKMSAAIPIEIVRIERTANKEGYYFEIRDPKTGKIGTGEIGHDAFLIEEENNPTYLGKWMRSTVNASLGRPTNS